MSVALFVTLGVVFIIFLLAGFMVYRSNNQPVAPVAQPMTMAPGGAYIR